MLTHLNVTQADGREVFISSLTPSLSCRFIQQRAHHGYPSRQPQRLPHSLSHKISPSTIVLQSLNLETGEQPQAPLVASPHPSVLYPRPVACSTLESLSWSSPSMPIPVVLGRLPFSGPAFAPPPTCTSLLPYHVSTACPLSCSQVELSEVQI